MAITSRELKEELEGFTGTEQYHRATMFPNFYVTDGVLAMAEKAGAFWLLDAIVSYQNDKRIHKKLSIQFWTLEVKDNKGLLYVVEDAGRPRLIEQEFSFTDFPEGKWKFYVQNGVMMLPSEY